ncbi:MAG: hypothetical protein ACODAF_09125 [Actinomycetota bacterium]
MAQHEASTLTSGLPGRIGAGVVGGLVGGVVFGLLMTMMDMMPMVADLIGSEAVAVGWLVHLVNSALFGAIFAVLFGRWAQALGPAIGIGLGYGALWWVLGALLIMPAWLGMSDMIFQVGQDQWLSLMGHLIYGLLLGVVYAPLVRRIAQRY